MRLFVFIGPTISEAECRAHLDATYLPPVSQGDVAGLLRFQPDAIGIVDGYFDQVPSVWHKEILLALSKGVRVIGAASMGALRAAELHPFGMEGVGKIFEWYRDGIIEADDEVALRHAPAELEYRPLSEALVNARATLEAACKEGVIAESARETLIELARSMPYWKRTAASMLEAGAQAGLSGDELTALKDYFSRRRIDQKKEDAIALLRYMASLEPAGRAEANFAVETTGYFHGLLDMDVRLGLPGERSQPTIGELTDFARLSLADFPSLMQAAGERRVRSMLASRLGLRVSTREVEEERQAFRARHRIETEEGLREWLVRNAATEEEMGAYLEELALEAKLRKRFAVSGNREALWQLREAGRFESLLGAWRERNAAWSEAGETPSQQELFLHYTKLTGVPRDEILSDAALRLGFRVKTNLMAELFKAQRAASGSNGKEG